MFHLDHGIDYRLQALDTAPLYHWPLGEHAEQQLRAAFTRLAPDSAITGGRLRIAGRSIPTRAQGSGVAWFDFAALCDGPRSQTDYIELTFPIIRHHVEAVVRVEEAAIVAAMRTLWERLKIVVELSAAVPLAAVASAPQRFMGQRIGLILSGGNVDLDRLPW